MIFLLIQQAMRSCNVSEKESCLAAKSNAMINMM